MGYNYDNLRQRIYDKGYTQDSLCMELRMNKGVFSLRINNQRSFRQEEIERICNILDIHPHEISKYFFSR